MSALGDALRSLAHVIDGRGLGWFVFGAQAVAVRGAPRATQDIDVTVQVDPGQLGELIADLESEGLRHRYPELADELLATGSVIPLVHPSGMEIDLVVAGSGLEALSLSRATRSSIDGVVVPVARATDLVVMKVLAGRGKDLEDVRALIAGGAVDTAEVCDLLEQLEAALGQTDLLPAFQAALDDAGDEPR